MSMADRPADHTKRSVKTIKTRENGDGIGEIRCHLCWRKWTIGGYCLQAISREVFFVSGAQRKSQKTRG